MLDASTLAIPDRPTAEPSSATVVRDLAARLHVLLDEGALQRVTLPTLRDVRTIQMRLEALAGAIEHEIETARQDGAERGRHRTARERGGLWWLRRRG